MTAVYASNVVPVPKTLFRVVIGLMAAIALFLMVSMVSCTTIAPGHVGVQAVKYGDDKGKVFAVPTGAFWYNPIQSDVLVFPTYQQRHIYDKDGDDGVDESISYRSAENAQVNADVGLTFNLVAEKVPHVYVTFRQDLQTLERTIIRDRLRSAFNRWAPKQKTMELLGSGQAALEQAVTDDLRKELEPHGIHIDAVQIVSRPRIDKEVETSINQVIQAMQQANAAEQKVRQARAEAEQKVAAAEGEKQARIALAQGEAEANRLLNESINERLIQLEALKRWNGVLPQMMGGTGAVPFIPVGR